MTLSDNSKTTNATRALKRGLLQEYESFADKRIKNIDKGKVFIIDDRGPSDFGADRGLFSWFCMIFAEVIDQDTVWISLHNNVPQGERVTAWCEENGARMTELSFAGDFSLEFKVTRGDQHVLSGLAEAFRSIVESGVRYSVSSYKYVCPRSAESLKRLQEVLSRAWG